MDQRASASQREKFPLWRRVKGMGAFKKAAVLWFFGANSCPHLFIFLEGFLFLSFFFDVLILRSMIQCLLVAIIPNKLPISKNCNMKVQLQKLSEQHPVFISLQVKKKNQNRSFLILNSQNV